MTTSTFSFVISPPLFWRDMRHIGDAQRLVAFHRAIDDVDGVGAKHGISDCAWPPRPAFNLVLPHAIDKLALIRGRQLRKISTEKFVAALVNRGNCGAVELRERRTEVEDAGLKQRFVRRHRKLLIYKVCDPALTRTVNASAPSVAPFTKPRRPMFAIASPPGVIFFFIWKM